MWTKFPTIKKAALEIAYDNGMINRFEPEASYLDKCLVVLGADGVYEDEIVAFEAFLLGLTQVELSDLCCGESSAMKLIVSRAPLSHDGHPLTGLLEDFFNVEA